MTTQAQFTLRGRNPDILSCIASLSNDEVFTPPEFANRMLDTIADAWAADHNGASIWEDSSVTFLDPCTKSGVFLREITRRLTDGLAKQIPDLQTRVDQILTKQVFGIGITRLTSLMARRSLYCTKHANGAHSIAKSFTNDAGNIWYDRMEHTWEGSKCIYCGAPKTILDRVGAIENYAYAFIHTDHIKSRIDEMFGANMQFDVIIGNPPYQLGSDGGSRDLPIYQKFVERAKTLHPRYLSMIIPSRWMATGLGLSDFRKMMLSDKRIRVLVDYPMSKEVFNAVEVKGGVCYFLWDASHDRDCSVETIRNQTVIGPFTRSLGEFDVFVRDVRAVSILRKVIRMNELSIKSLLSADKEFGWTSNYDGFHLDMSSNDVPLYYVRKGRRGIGFVNRNDVLKSGDMIDSWKVMVPSAGSDASSVPDYVLSTPVIAPSPSVCTQTYLFFRLASELEAMSLRSYLSTRFVRFLISLRKITQHATRSTYEWVPMQIWDRVWTDSELFDKYEISEEERLYIETMIKPVSWVD
jgi:site-specific DNA-methyltransferase (adenine-specific)